MEKERLKTENQLVRDLKKKSKKKNQAIQGCHSNKSEFLEMNLFFSYKYNYMNEKYIYEKVN